MFVERFMEGIGNLIEMMILAAVLIITLPVRILDRIVYKTAFK